MGRLNNFEVGRRRPRQHKGPVMNIAGHSRRRRQQHRARQKTWDGHSRRRRRWHKAPVRKPGVTAGNDVQARVCERQIGMILRLPPAYAGWRVLLIYPRLAPGALCFRSHTRAKKVTGIRLVSQYDRLTRGPPRLVGLFSGLSLWPAYTDVLTTSSSG